MAHLGVYFRINLLRLSLQPCRLRLHHGGQLHYALLETKVGAPQVFLRAVCTGACQGQLLLGLTHFERALAHLQAGQFACLFIFECGYGGGILCCTYLIGHVAPVEYGHSYEHSHVPCSPELFLKTVVYVGVAHRISAYEHYLRQSFGSYQLDRLLAHVHRVLQHFQFRTGFGRSRLLYRNVGVGRCQRVAVFIGQLDVFVEWQSAPLAQQHLCQSQTVVHLCEGHLGLIGFHAHSQSVRPCCHSFLYHLVHIGVELLYQREIAFSQTLLVGQRHNGPVGLFRVVNSLLPLGFARVGCHLLAQIGHAVEGCDGSSHKHRLGHCDRSGEDVARVCAESVYNRLPLGVQSLCGFAQFVAHLSHHLIGGGAQRSQCLIDCGHLVGRETCPDVLQT